MDALSVLETKNKDVQLELEFESVFESFDFDIVAENNQIEAENKRNELIEDEKALVDTECNVLLEKLNRIRIDFRTLIRRQNFLAMKHLID